MALQTAKPSAKWKKAFFTIWTGQSFSILGSMLVQFSLIWWLTQQTGSATVLATASLVGLLPGVFLGPFAGALVDRWNRRLVMIVADGVVALATLVLIGLFWAGIVQIWHIYIALLVRSLGGTFHWPAMQASTSLMVPDEHLSRIAGINQALGGAINIIGPPLGALLLGVIPLHAVLSIDVVTAAIAILPLLFVAIPQPVQRVTTPVTPLNLLRDVREGFRYMVSWPGLMAIGIMATLINFLLSPTSALIPLLVTKHFHGGVWHLGWVESASGVGVVVGGLLLGVWGGFRRKIYTSLLGVTGIGIGVLFIGLAPAPAFWMAITGTFIAGFMNPIANGPLFALMQSRVAPEMQGRVFTLLGSVASAMTPLSMICAGPIADALGIQVWYYVGGLITLMMGIGAFFVPTILNADGGQGSSSFCTTTQQIKETGTAMD